MIYKIKTKDNKVYYVKQKDSRYPFPELTKEDLRKAAGYNLRLVKKLPDGDCVLEGSKKLIK